MTIAELQNTAFIICMSQHKLRGHGILTVLVWNTQHLTFYSLEVSLYTTRFNIQKFCVERFVQISEQTATFALYIINWSVFITKVESVYGTVRTDSVYKADYTLSLKVKYALGIFYSSIIIFMWHQPPAQLPWLQGTVSVWKVTNDMCDMISFHGAWFMLIIFHEQ
jgi:hypothetical protein